MILIDKESGLAVRDGLMGLDAEQAWGVDWVNPYSNTSNAFAYNGPVPSNFAPYCFKLVDETLVPTEMYAGAQFELKKNSMLNRVVNIRDRREASGFPYMGKTMDSDPRSVSRINTAVQAANFAVSQGAPFILDWTCADNSTIELDAVALLGMPVALATFANGLHQRAKELKNAIVAATTDAGLDAIDVESGWPEA